MLNVNRGVKRAFYLDKTVLTDKSIRGSTEVIIKLEKTAVVYLHAFFLLVSVSCTYL